VLGRDVFWFRFLEKKQQTRGGLALREDAALPGATIQLKIYAAGNLTQVKNFMLLPSQLLA
jgi:hypothetical protein